MPPRLGWLCPHCLSPWIDQTPLGGGLAEMTCQEGHSWRGTPRPDERQARAHQREYASVSPEDAMRARPE